MNKVIVGIVPSSSCFTTEDPFQDKYSFVNSYSKKIIASGGIPIGILLEDEKINIEALNLCFYNSWFITINFYINFFFITKIIL